MHSVVISGIKTSIAQAFANIVPGRYTIVPGRSDDIEFPLDAEVYLFCQGVLYPKQQQDQTAVEMINSYVVNYASIADCVDKIIEINAFARVCIIGSESAYRGSYDQSYADAKRQIHDYVEHKKLWSEHQQLVCISPSIIQDSGMTQRREDKEELEHRRMRHPKQRYLKAMEVARMAHTLLFEQPYISGTVIRMHGGDV